ncbi:MAG: hypothetical protein J6Z42_03100 [Lachnospiraceae bacterium]|nr:hypothetical protein [Lachnospiraceae bacterium]
MIKHKSTILIIAILCTFFLAACGETRCDFCGEEKQCKVFEINGVMRNICNDCLNNTASAVSGNVARGYAKLYEDGVLEYPSDSPLKPVSDTPVSTEATEKPSAPDIIIPSVPDGDTDISDAASVIDSEEPSFDKNETADISGSDTFASSDDRVDNINRGLLPEGFSLSEDGSGSGRYNMMSGDTDTGIDFTFVDDKLKIEEYDENYAQQYVKAVIRTILAYTNSNDYDGYGHDVYNSTLENGNYKSGGVTFFSSVGTTDEIEKGYPLTTFTIVP